MGQAALYEDENDLWTPAVSTSLFRERSGYQRLLVSRYQCRIVLVRVLTESCAFFLQGNPSIVNREKSQELFPVEENIRFISVLFEAKDDNIITV